VALQLGDIEFDERGVEVIGISVDPVTNREHRAADIEETQGAALDFPLIGNLDRRVSQLYDMTHPKANETLTVRSVFVIGPGKKVKWPRRDWKRGEDVIIVPSLCDEEAKKKLPGGWKSLKPYLGPEAAGPMTVALVRGSGPRRASPQTRVPRQRSPSSPIASITPTA
jgi:hypothetical protein